MKHYFHTEQKFESTWHLVIANYCGQIIVGVNDRLLCVP